MKKPKLRKYILKSCFTGFVLFLILFIIAIYIADIFNSYRVNNICDEFQSDVERTVRDQLFNVEPKIFLKDGLKSNDYGQKLANVDFIIKFFGPSYPCFTALYDKEGNVISDPSKAVFFTIYKKNNDNTEDKIRLESDYNDIWDGVFDNLYRNHSDEKLGKNSLGLPEDETFGELTEDELIDNPTNISDEDADGVGTQTQIVFDEIYYKGGYFVPGKVRVRLKVTALKGDKFIAFSKDVYETDMTPADVSEYNRISFGDESGEYYYKAETGPTCAGISSDTALWKDYEYYLDYNKQKVDFFSVNEYYDEMVNIDKGFMHHLNGCATDISFDGDKDIKYVFLSMNDYSVFSSFEDVLNEKSRNYSVLYEMWIPFGLLVAFLFIIMTIIIGWLKYTKKKSSYDMYCYRMETTNAMAHDLKTPLAAISGYAENLVEQVHVDKREYYAKSILSNVEYMDKMIHDILELSKSEDARQEINAEEIELAEIVDDEINSLSSIISERELSVSVSGNCKLRTDKKMITSLVDNLISNAVRYAKEKTEITIILADKKTVDASFNGKGMMIKNTLSSPLQKTVEELKKPYVKGDDSRGSRSGSGVGLTIVENVAKKLRCKVVYDVTDEDFSVKLMF